MFRLLTLFCFALICLSLLDCRGQEHKPLYFVQTSLSDYNLKFRVKEVTVELERFYPDNLGVDKIQEYELKNFWSVNQVPLGKHLFNDHGFVWEVHHRYLDTLPKLPFYETWNKKWKQEFDLEDYNNKLEQFGHNAGKHPFPVLSPLKIMVNNVMESYSRSEQRGGKRVERQFEYKIDHTDWVLCEIERDEKDIQIRKKYAYDNYSRIIKQDMLFMEEVSEEKRLFLDVSLKPWYIILSINNRGQYEYEYTEKGKLRLIRLIVGDNILFQENYHYSDKSLRPFKLDRYVVSAITSRNQFSDYSTEWYNEFGDITKAENYDNDKNLIRTQFYDYEYDSHNNWIECRMYLEGQPERTEKPTIVAYRTIVYYED